MKSEILAIRIESDLLDYLRELSNKEQRTIAKQVAYLIQANKQRSESLKALKERIGTMPTKGK
jgi:ribonucleotide reductase beta subunit family protein with ferritin-like domain